MVVSFAGLSLKYKMKTAAEGEANHQYIKTAEVIVEGCMSSLAESR